MSIANSGTARADFLLDVDRRKHPRTAVDEAGYISSSGLSIRCRVRNISANGAAIEVPNPAYVPNSFQLMTANDRVTRDCRIVWVAQNRIGVIFIRIDGHPIAE